MSLLRKGLIWLRSQDNRDDLRLAFIWQIAIIMLISVIFGVVLDILVPFNFTLNMVRGLIANITGFSGAAIIYLLYNKYKRNKLSKNIDYLSIRKRFSYKQRVNMSIVIGAVLFLFMLLQNKQNSLYTFKAASLIMFIVLLLIFCRRDRDEFLKDIYQIPDIRDLELMSKKNELESGDNKKNKKNKKTKKFE